MPSTDQENEDSGGNDDSEFSRQHALELALSERDLASEVMSLQERIEREEVKRKESVQRTVSPQPNKKTTSLVVPPTSSEDDEETLANARRQAVDLALKEEKQAAANPGGTPTQTTPAASERPRPTPAVVSSSSRRRRLAQQQGSSSLLRSFRRSSGRLFDTARRRWRGKGRREAMAHDTAAAPGAVKVRGVDYEGGECPSDDEMDYLDGSSMCVFNCQDTTVTLAGDSPEREQPQSAPTNQPKEDPPSTTTVGAKQKKVALALLVIVLLLLAALGIGLGIFLSGDDNDENTETPSPSATMSLTAVDQRMENLRMRLSPISGATLDDLSSVQYETLSWLVYEDEAEVEAMQFPQLKQRYIVALLYFATGGDNWTDPHNFLSAGSVCEWTHAGKGVFCNTDDTVMGIYLNGIGLQGSIPFELFLLESLESLDLSENLDLMGSLPGVQVVSSALTQLIVFGCGLAGTIPESLASIPSLEWVDLRSNNLEGSVPAFTNSLEVLRLSGNQLSGDVETLFSSEKENLWVLDLAGNRLNGTIPVGIGSATALQVVYLGTTSSYSNQFSGPIPSEFGGLTALQQLYIGHNSFSNVIPTELGSLSALEYLAMGHAQLSGPLPSNLGLLTSLRYLDVSSNELTGQLPSELGKLSNLESAYFDSNHIEGSVPDSFAALSLLNILHLHGNGITGDLSPVFCEGPFSIDNFISDCRPPEEVLCSCCSKCCDTDGANCQ